MLFPNISKKILRKEPLLSPTPSSSRSIFHRLFALGWSKKNFAAHSVNTFSEHFSESFGKVLRERTAVLLPHSSSPPSFESGSELGGLNKNFELPSVNNFPGDFLKNFGEKRRKNRSSRLLLGTTSPLFLARRVVKGRGTWNDALMVQVLFQTK